MSHEGKVVECRGNQSSRAWHTVLSFAGQDVTLLYAQMRGCAEIENHHRTEFEAHFSNLVCDMYDAGHVSFHVVGMLES